MRRCNKTTFRFTAPAGYGTKNAYATRVVKKSFASAGPLSTLSSSLRDSLRDSVHAMLGVEKVVHNDAAVARIRQAMMRLHGERGLDLNPRLHHRIATARDAEVLWYARAELFADLCRWHDEPQAISALASLRPLFRGSLPASLLKSRTPGDVARRSGKR